MSWLQAFKQVVEGKPYRLYIIYENQIDEYKAQGFEVRRLDPSVTGNWVHGNTDQANEYIKKIERENPDYLQIAANDLWRQGWRAEGYRD